MSAQNYWAPLLPSAARTATPTTVDLPNAYGQQLTVVLDVTAVTATPALTVTIKGKDPLSGTVWTILASTAVATVSTTVLKVGRGLTAAANLVANDTVPALFQIEVAHGDADSATYSIGYHLGL